MKYVLISGGVVSGLGKGITASSIGLLLKESGLNVTAIKIDPYMNIDAGKHFFFETCIEIPFFFSEEQCPLTNTVKFTSLMMVEKQI